MKRTRLGVLISGSGSNLQSLIDACAAPDYPAEIKLVLSNKADAFGLERAAKAGIDSAAIAHKAYANREGFERALTEKLEAADIEYVGVKKDVDVTAEDIAAHNLVLWGDPASNSLIAKTVGQLPVQWSASELTVKGQRYNAATTYPTLIYPNPLNGKKYVVLNSGFTFREFDNLNNARQIAKLPDWAVIDATAPANGRYPGKVAAAGFFDERWQ